MAKCLSVGEDENYEEENGDSEFFGEFGMVGGFFGGFCREVV